MSTTQTEKRPTTVISTCGHCGTSRKTGVSINFGTSEWVVQHNRWVLFWKAFLSKGVGGAWPPGKFWNPRLSQTHFPAFWGLFLFCFVVLRSQPIWTNLKEKKKTSTQIDSRMTHYLSTKKKERDTKVWPQRVDPFQCPQLTLGRIFIVRSLLFWRWSKIFNSNSHQLLATASIHPKSQFPVDFH